MSLVRAGLRPAFALFVLAHAAAHLLSRWQGFLSPESLANDPAPPFLIGIAVLGFAIAGAGLLGVKWCQPLIGAALVLASAYSLIAIGRMGAGNLWWGVPVDLALFLIGVTGTYPKAHAPLAEVGAHHALPPPHRRFV
jgi:hypothetical protein